jgi:hypothetical protein
MSPASCLRSLCFRRSGTAPSDVQSGSPGHLPALRGLRLCALCLFCSLSFCAAALDREAFTITKYDLNVQLDPSQQRLGARGTITLRNDSAQPQKIATLQISSSLNWRAIRVAGKTVQFVSQPYASDVDHSGSLSEALVSLPSEINPKGSVELEIGYEGVIPLDATRLQRVGVPDEIAKRTSWDRIDSSFTAVRGAGYVAWYPIATESADFSEGNSLFEVVDRWKAREAESEFKANISLSGTTNEHRTLVCTGAEALTSAASLKTHAAPSNCSWESLGLVAPSFVVADYAALSKPPLSLFTLSGHDAGPEKYSAALEPASKFVTPWFGEPRAPVAIADFADPRAAPFESGTLLLVSMVGEDTRLAGINLVHELVHSAVASPRPWVYEGLAHFGEALYREQQGGRDAALDLLGSHRAAFLDSEKDLAADPGKNPGQPLATTFDETYYRSKAAYVWWMLRDMIGDDALKRAIRSYRAADDTDPKYVERLIAASSTRDLGWFFDDWVYHDRGLPEFRVQSVHPWEGAKDNGQQAVNMITIIFENLGSAGGEVPFTVHCEGNDVTRRIEVHAKSTATLRVELPSQPLEIVINDGSVPESDTSNNVYKLSRPAGDQK